MIKVEHVYQTYPGPIHALRDINFTVFEGQVTYVIGSSGAGKSSLLNIMMGTYEPTSGSIYFENDHFFQSYYRTRLKIRQDMGVIFQDFKLLSDQTLFENIMLSLIIRNYRSVVARKEVNKVAEFLQIESILNRYPHQVSGGQQQRAAIARAIVHNPKYIFADEPTGSLDVINSHIIFQALHQIAKEGKCVVVATHNVELIKHFSNYQIIHLKNGQIYEAFVHRQADSVIA